VEIEAALAGPYWGDTKLARVKWCQHFLQRYILSRLRSHIATRHRPDGKEHGHLVTRDDAQASAVVNPNELSIKNDSVIDFDEAGPVIVNYRHPTLRMRKS
jgi:hypothetical protein